MYSDKYMKYGEKCVLLFFYGLFGMIVEGNFDSYFTNTTNKLAPKRPSFYMFLQKFQSSSPLLSLFPSQQLHEDSSGICDVVFLALPATQYE
jgi:hypothetical protein